MSSQEVTWGGISFWAEQVPSGSLDQVMEGFRTGLEIERVSQQKSMKYRISDFSSGGMARYGGIYTVTEGINLLAYNEGLQSRIPKQLTLPYLLTTQSAVTAYDISSLTAANMRIHAFLSSLGDTGLRWLGALGVRLLGDTSVSDPALVSRKTWTNSVTSAAEIVLNSTTYAAFATNGQTDDVRGTTDVSGSGTPTFVELVTYGNSADAFYAMHRFSQWQRTMFIGTFNGVTGIWCAKDSDTIPVTSMTPVVFTSSMDVPSADAAIVSYGPLEFRTIGQDAGSMTITNITNLLVNDTSSATASTNRSVSETINFTVYDPAGDQSLPPSIIPTGITVEIEGMESAGTANCYVQSVSIGPGGIAKTQTLSGGTEFAIDPSTSTFTFGGSQDRWGANLTNAAVLAPNFSVSWVIDFTDTAQTWSGEHVNVTFHGVLPGTQIVLNRGGWTSGGVPWSATILPYIQPTRNNTSDLNVPTELVYVQAAYDSGGDRLTAEITKIPTEMRYIWHAKPYLGGVAVCGGNKASERGTVLKLVDADGNVRNLNFPGIHGTTPVFINHIEAQGEWLILDVWNTDGTDRQWWYYRNGKYYADTILQSLSGTSAASLGIPYAESTLSHQQNRIYSIFPASTNTAAARQFIPSDLLADPLTLNTSETKTMAFSAGTENTALRARTVETDFGPEEAKKSLMVISYQRRNVSSTSTITVDVMNDGTTTFSSPSATNTFTTALSEYNVPSAGLDYQTLITRLGGKHTAASTASPNLLPILYDTSQQWPHRPTYDFLIDVQKMGLPDYLKKLDAMNALMATKHTQALRFGDREPLPTRFESYSAGSIRVPPRGQSITTNDLLKPPIWRFTTTRGTV